MVDNANRDRGAECVAAPAVHRSLEVDLALLSSDDERLRNVELTLVNPATH
jgi:hypothetical protein